MIHLEKLKAALDSRAIATIHEVIKAYPAVLEAVDEKGISGLMLIACYQIPEALELAIDKKEHFSLHEAAALGLLEEVKKQLADNPKAIHTFSQDGFPPLTLACYFGHSEVVHHLIEQGAKINTVAKNPAKVMPLHAAVARNNFEICKMLIENGADVNATQEQGISPLHSAAHRGNLKIVQLLVENGANIGAKMTNGQTALDFAEKDGHQAVKDYLEMSARN